MYIPSFSETYAVAQSQGILSRAPHLWDGLVGYWPLNEGGGRAIDLARDNYGSRDGGPLWIIGKYGKCLNFDGSDDRVLVDQTSVLQPSTVSFSIWFCPDNTTDRCFVLNQYLAWMLQYYSGSLRFRAWYDDGGSRTIVNSYDVALQAGNWYHVVGIARPNRNIILYVNGEEISSKSFPGNIWYDQVSSHFILSRSGWWADGSTRFTGQINNTCVYNRPLFHSEIQQIYQEPWVMSTKRKVVTTFVMNRPIPKKVLLLKRNSVTTLIH